MTSIREFNRFIRATTPVLQKHYPAATRFEVSCLVMDLYLSLHPEDSDMIDDYEFGKTPCAIFISDSGEVTY